MWIKPKLHNADEISRRLFESNLETAAALYCRLYEKSVKLTALYAVSENPEAPQMSADAVRWASVSSWDVTHGRKRISRARRSGG